MLVLAVTPPDGPTRLHVFVAGEIRIGDRDDSELRLPGANPRHARIVIADHKFVIAVDLRSTTGTTYNGAPLATPVVLRSSDRLAIAGHLLQLVDVAPKRLSGKYAPADPAELALLDAIADGDDDSLMIYADWLESHGDLVRAEIMRRRGNGRHISVPFLELLLGTDVAWRVRALRPPIEGCTRRDCAGEWGALARTPADDVRTCATCSRNTRYCTDVSQAIDELRRGTVVVIDPLALRSSGDLPTPRPG